MSVCVCVCVCVYMSVCVCVCVCVLRQGPTCCLFKDFSFCAASAFGETSIIKMFFKLPIFFTKVDFQYKYQVHDI